MNSVNYGILVMSIESTSALPGVFFRIPPSRICTRDLSVPAFDRARRQLAFGQFDALFPIWEVLENLQPNALLAELRGDAFFCGVNGFGFFPPFLLVEKKPSAELYTIKLGVEPFLKVYSRKNPLVSRVIFFICFRTVSGTASTR